MQISTSQRWAAAHKASCFCLSFLRVVFQGHLCECFDSFGGRWGEQIKLFEHKKFVWSIRNITPWSLPVSFLMGHIYFLYQMESISLILLYIHIFKFMLVEYLVRSVWNNDFDIS